MAMMRTGIVIVSMLAACGGRDEAGEPADAATPDAAPDAGDPAVRLSGTVASVDVNGIPAPLTGAMICVDGDPSRCATADAAGDYALDLPVDTPDLLLAVTASDRPPFLVGHPTGAAGADTLDLYLPTATVIMAQYTECGGDYPEAAAGVLLELRVAGAGTPTPFAGAEAALAGGAVEPCYWGGIQQPDADLSATTEAGLGFVQLLNVATDGGTAAVTITAPAATCSSDPAWVGDAPNVVDVPVRAGTFTYLALTCS